MAILQKLADIQDRLFVPKSNVNDFGHYNYRSCEDILKAVKPICKELGCVLYITNDLVEIGNRNYVSTTVTLADIETGESVVSTAHAREEETKKGMDGSQITGASSSYARKYALAGLFCIDNEQDSDATNKGDKTESKDLSKTMLVDKGHIATIKAQLEEKGINEKSFFICLGKQVGRKISTFEEITIHEFKVAMEMFGATK